MAGFVRQMLAKMGIVGELIEFLWHRKRYWLIPMILGLIVFTALLIAASSTALAPFIYTLF